MSESEPTGDGDPTRGDESAREDDPTHDGSSVSGDRNESDESGEAAGMSVGDVAKAPDACPLRVMSFNVRVNVEKDGEDAWPNRKDFVADLIRFHRPDVVGVQEALPGQLAYLEEALPEFNWVGRGRLGDEEGEAVPVGFRADRLRVAETGTFWLSESPEEVGSQSWEASHPRIATWTRLVDDATDTTLTVFNTHFDHESETARERSAKLLLRRIAAVDPDGPTLLVGDFNCTEESDPYRILTGETAAEDLPDDVAEARETVADVAADVVAAADERANAPGLRDARYTSEEGHYGPEATIHRFTGEAKRKIDFVFTTPDVRVLRHAVLSDQEMERYPSDHFPVMADLVLPTD